MTKHKDKVIPLINKKILVVGLIVIAIGAVLISISPQSKVSSLIDKITGNTQPAIDNIQFITIIEGKQTTLNVLKKDLLFNITITYDKNTNILKKYHKVIVLHNEYVTKREFDAITSHPNVIYLFPNALYAEVRTDYSNSTFTLIRGHGYPIPSIANGFDWKFDNSNLEYDVNCENMTFTIIPNGKMLTCYPAYRSLFDKAFLEAIKES